MIKPAELSTLKQRYKVKRDEMDTEWVTHWKDLADYILPRHGRFEDRDTIAGKGGKNKARNIVNNTVNRAVSVAVSGLKGGLVPHSLPWFRLGLWDDDMAKFGPNKTWLHNVAQIIYAALGKCNFYSAVHTPFEEQIVFGTGPMQVYKDMRTTMHCIPWTVGEYVLMTDDTGRVDTGFRWYWMTARQMMRQFGKEKLSKAVQGCIDRGDYERTFKVINAIYPRRDHEPGFDNAEQMSWGSLWWEDGGDKDAFLLESGFNTQPVMFPRWTVIGEDAYGSTCPGMDALGDIKMLQTMEIDKLRAHEMMANPPMNIPSTFKGRLSLLPGARNYVNTAENEAVRRTIEIDYRLADVTNEILRVEQRIKEGFFNDLFLMILNDKNMTATEVARRHEEKLAILGPTIERQNSEFLSPFIDRVFDILQEEGRIPPPPPDLQGQELKVEYISLLAQAQKAVGTTGMEKTLGFVTALAQIKPEAVDKIDEDAWVEEYGDLVGLKPRLIRPDEEVDKMREGRQQEMAKQAQMAQMDQMAGAAQKLGNTPVEEGNALGGLLSQIPAP